MKKHLLLLVFVCASLSAMAQTGYYLLKGPVNGNPRGLNTDLEFTNTDGWTNLLTGQYANPTWTANQNLPAGFAFKFNDVSVTSYKVSTTGVLTFDVSSQAAAPVEANATLPNAGIPDKSIMMWGLNMKNPSNIGSRICTKMFGTAPNRQFWIQLGFLQEENLQTGWVCASIVLEETTNFIYIVEQRTVGLNGNTLLSPQPTTSLTVGVQIDANTGVTTSGGAAHKNVSVYDADPKDNTYWIFRPGSQPTGDAEVLSVEMDNFLILGSKPYDVKFRVHNNGSAAITSLDADYSIAGGAAVAGTISGLNIAPGTSAIVTHPTKWNPSTEGAYNVSITVTNVNAAADGYTGDNTLAKSVSVVETIVDRKSLHEIFSSSTCGPCAPGNVNYNNVIDGKSKHSYVKYQMNYPGTGDPYYTAEAGTRHSFYGINSIPRMQIDGGWNSNAGSFTTALYDQYQQKPAFMEITGSASNKWKNTITTNVTITPKANYSSTNLVLFAAICESETFNNKKSNGETEFHHVMKKMVPNASGTALTALTKNTAVNRTLTYSFPGAYKLASSGASPINLNTENSVETWDDLIVVVWVQDIVTKEVMQSETFVVANNNNPSVNKNAISVYPSPATDVIHVEASAAFKGTKTTVTVTNMLGQVVHTGSTDSGNYEFNASALSNGMYLITVSNGTTILTEKVQVTH